MPIVTIQLLRAIAAWAVVFHHVEQIFFQFKVNTFWGWLFATKGPAGVELFFAISGFVMVVSTYDKDVTGSEFFVRRLARIVPSYWLFTTLMAAAILLIPALAAGVVRLDSKHLALSLSFLSGFFPGHFYPVLTVGWSLNFEMIFYVLFAASLGLADKIPLKLRPWILPVMLLTLQFYPLRAPGAEMLASSLMLVFLLGYGLSALFVRGRLPTPQWLGWPLIGLGLSLVLVGDVESFVTWGVGGAAILWGALCFEPRVSSKKWIVGPGDWSYATYLAHPIVLLVAKQLYDTTGIGPVWLWIALSLTIILLLSWQTFERLERPIAHFIQHTLAKRAHG